MMKLEMISKYPPNGTHPTPLLFIHGTMHGAWCWDVYFLDYFAQHGFAAHAINLRGHGDSEGRDKLRWTRISDFVETNYAVQQYPAHPFDRPFMAVLSYPAHASRGSACPHIPCWTLPTALRNARRHRWPSPRST
jgi:pimeloyl-ACP methyl ester carboxylesterase